MKSTCCLTASEMRQDAVLLREVLLANLRLGLAEGGLAILALPRLPEHLARDVGGVDAKILLESMPASSARITML